MRKRCFMCFRDQLQRRSSALVLGGSSVAVPGHLHPSHPKNSSLAALRLSSRLLTMSDLSQVSSWATIEHACSSVEIGVFVKTTSAAPSFFSVLSISALQPDTLKFRCCDIPYDLRKKTLFKTVAPTALLFIMSSPLLMI